MTRYASDLDTPDRVRRADGRRTRSPRCSPRTALRQLHVAETEKYAHVTYFFNGGREERVAGRDARSSSRARATCRATTTSRRCPPTRSPSASSTRSGTATRSASSTSRTPTWSATRARSRRSIAAVETADRCLGRVVERVTELGGVCLVTADHGNAEQMLEADGVSPHTAHTTNPVPLIVTAPGADACASGGELADLAPTALRAARDRAAAGNDG